MPALMELHILDKAAKRTGDVYYVEYAPNELAFGKSVQYADVAIPGLNQPVAQFIRGDAETLTLNLFLDSTKTGMNDDATSVTEDAEKLAKLVAVRADLHRPPLVQLIWGDDFPAPTWGAGGQSEPVFTCIVLSVNRTFTLFAPNGKPLRATVTLSLKRYATIAEQLDAMNLQSADHTRLHVVTEGETLPLIAYDAYEDPAQWRLIAEHNALSDVRELPAGLRLELPPLPVVGRRS
jgi:Contractile injection system tube protein